jgi:methyl coenzyme M reductase alpha subunit
MRSYVLHITVVLGSLSLFACSSSTDDSTTFDPAKLAPFSSFCTGALKVDQSLMTPVGGGVWMGGSLMASAGTQFLISEDFSKYGGYVIQDDGTPAEIDADFSTGLVKDVDFTSTCATAGSVERFALLVQATFYANEQLTGTACTMDVATAFLTSHSYVSGDPAEFSAPELTSKCGWSVGYTSDGIFATLLML